MVKLEPGQQVPVTVSAFGRDGQPAPVEAGSVRFQSDDARRITVETNPTETSAIIRSEKDAEPGACAVQVSADADLGEGVRTLSKQLQIEILPPGARSLSIEVGDVMDSTPATAPAEG